MLQLATGFQGINVDYSILGLTWQQPLLKAYYRNWLPPLNTLISFTIIKYYLVFVHTIYIKKKTVSITPRPISTDPSLTVDPVCDLSRAHPWGKLERLWSHRKITNSIPNSSNYLQHRSQNSQQRGLEANAENKRHDNGAKVRNGEWQPRWRCEMNKVVNRALQNTKRYDEE